MSQDALELLLNGVKDQAQRKQITAAYYAFANGDPETFAVQFAVLLRAHAISLKLLPSRLDKMLATEIHKMSDLVSAHQKSVEKMASLIKEEPPKSGGAEEKVASGELQMQLAAHAEVLRTERERIASALVTNGRLHQKLAAQRIILGLILSFMAGVLSVLFFQHVLPLLLLSLV
jgi:hypothetical protein